MNVESSFLFCLECLGDKMPMAGEYFVADGENSYRNSRLPFVGQSLARRVIRDIWPRYSLQSLQTETMGLASGFVA